MISASLNRCKGLEDQVGDFLKQLAAKLELVLFFPKKLLMRSFEKNDAVSIPVLNTFKITTFPHREHRSNITESPFYNCIGSRNANKRQSTCSKLCVRMLLSLFCYELMRKAAVYEL